MHRIIGRDVFEGKYADEHELTIHELGHGHREISISRSVWWEHTATMSDEAYALYLQAVENQTDEQLAERKASNLKRSARRATTKLRRTCKVMGVDALLTLTYAFNQQDLALCKKHLKEFVRRMRKLIPGFAYVAAFERQKRGAWHVHMAIHALPMNLAASNGVKVKSYGVVRAVWRSVVGELGGNIDQARRKRNSRKTPAKMAAYISKYILKAFEDGEDHSNRYSASAVDMPAAVRVRIMGEKLVDLISLVYVGLGGDVLSSPWLSRFGDRFFVTSELPPPWLH